MDDLGGSTESNESEELNGKSIILSAIMWLTSPFYWSFAIDKAIEKFLIINFEMPEIEYSQIFGVVVFIGILNMWQFSFSALSNKSTTELNELSITIRLIAIITIRLIAISSIYIMEFLMNWFL